MVLFVQLLFIAFTSGAAHCGICFTHSEGVKSRQALRASITAYPRKAGTYAAVIALQIRTKRRVTSTLATPCNKKQMEKEMPY